jgi:hypothetical protein
MHMRHWQSETWCYLPELSPNARPIQAQFPPMLPSRCPLSNEKTTIEILLCRMPSCLDRTCLVRGSGSEQAFWPKWRAVQAGGDQVSETSQRTASSLKPVLHTTGYLWAQPLSDICCHLNSKVSPDTKQDGLKFCGTRLGRQSAKGARFSWGWQRLYSNSFLARFVSTGAPIPIMEDSRVAPATVAAFFVSIIQSSRLKMGSRTGVTGPDCT